MEEEAPAPWSDIPVDLAGLVLGCLPAHVDRVRFAAMCPQWRAAARHVSVPPPMPMLLLLDATVYSLPGIERFRFRGCAGYADACGNWLVFRYQKGRRKGCFLRDPFSKATVRLPALSRIRLQLVGDETDDEELEEEGNTWVEKDDGEKLDASKIIFCSPHLIAAIFTFTELLNGLAVCQPGTTSWWSVRMDLSDPFFHDIVFHQGKLYALSCMRSLFAVDICMNHSTGDPCISQIKEVISELPHHFILTPGILTRTVSYLVESCGHVVHCCWCAV
jgi:hypothetical protein